MRITPFVRMQLVIFSIITVIAVAVMAVVYLRLPSMVGIGKYTVTVAMPNTGGLYQNANVAYRGIDVGKVDSVQLTPGGVKAQLSIDSSSKIPENSTATVRSVSAIGEQYVQFTVPKGVDPSSSNLKDGATVDVASQDMPTDIASMLDRADALLKDVQDTKLRDVLDEAFTAFNGTGEDLQRLLDSTELFVTEANRNAETITKLIDQAGPLLDTQTATNGSIRQWTSNLVKFTDQLRANNPQLVGVLQKGPKVAADTQGMFSDMGGTLPVLFDNLNTSVKTLAVYHAGLKQVVVLYPRLISILLTAVNSIDTRYGINGSFVAKVNDSAPCTVGYLPADTKRSPAVQTPRELPPGTMCRVPQDAQMYVRGARNFPCIEIPGRRASTPEECRTGYKPSSQPNVPLPKGLPFVGPSGFISQAGPQNGPGVYATSYDPSTGDYIGPDGKAYKVAAGGSAGQTYTAAPRSTGASTTSGKAPGGGASWQKLITAETE